MRHIICFRSFLLLLGCFIILPAASAVQATGDKVFNFAVGWRVDSAQSENVMQLGTVYQCPTGWCAIIEEYSGQQNLPRVRLKYRHSMQADTGAQGCTDEYLTSVKGKRSVEIKAELKSAGSGYVLELGKYRYVWDKDLEKSAGYLLKEAGEVISGARQYSQQVGFSYWSDDIQETHFERSQYNAHFDGKIAHKDSLKGASDDWKEARTSIDFRKFSASTNGSPVLGLTVDGHPEVLKRMRTPVKVHQSVLPPTSHKRDRLRFFNHEYGHDFNANGCFDEFGHNKFMLPILHNNIVQGFVFVEYTHDKFDGIPMISIGRYNR